MTIAWLVRVRPRIHRVVRKRRRLAPGVPSRRRLDHDVNVAATGNTAEAAWFQQSSLPPRAEMAHKAGRSTCWIRLRARVSISETDHLFTKQLLCQLSYAGVIQRVSQAFCTRA